MQSLQSFSTPVRVLVVGASGAIGSALIDALAQCREVEQVLAASRRPPSFGSDKVVPCTLDILDEHSIESALVGVERIDLAIVATGSLHVPGGRTPEKSWRSLEQSALLESFAVNAIGPALVAKHVLPRLPRRGKSVFAALSARVGSISDNRLGGWYSYRASKAALNQLVRSLSIELARQRPEAVCVSLHPGTVDSALSRPFQANVPAAVLTAPALAAKRLLAVIEGLDATSSGQLIGWDGRPINP